MIYKSYRVGKNGKPFFMYKFKTLKNDSSHFAQDGEYTRFGKFLRRVKLDEVLQIVNIFKGEMSLVGPRPEEERTLRVLPLGIKDILLSRKPGITSLASVCFFNEEEILKLSNDPHKTYWMQIKPLKINLDIFYIQNRDIFLDIWIVWKTFVLVLKELFK